MQPLDRYFFHCFKVKTLLDNMERDYRSIAGHLGFHRVVIPHNSATETSEHGWLQTRSQLPSKINKRLLTGLSASTWKEE